VAAGGDVHELSITQSVVDAVSQRVGEQQVTSIRVAVGKLSGIEPDAMRFCFELVTNQTSLEGATLDIDEPPGRAHCRTCEQDFVLPDLILLCPCGSADVSVVSGRELTIISVDVVPAGVV
jgi:hydrogenase nickel incorporation protein HypA/HybF